MGKEGGREREKKRNITWISNPIPKVYFTPVLAIHGGIGIGVGIKCAFNMMQSYIYIHGPGRLAST